MIERGAQLGPKILSFDTSSHGAVENASRIICGSWSSDYDFKPTSADADGSAYTTVRERIADAMRDDESEKVGASIKLPNGLNNKVQ